MPPRTLVILINDTCDPAFLDPVRDAAPAAELLTRDDLARDPDALARVDVVYGRLHPDSLPAAGRLKWIHATAAGVDWVQHPAVRAHPAVVTNSRFHGPQVCEQLWAMLLMLVRAVDKTYRTQLARQWRRPTRRRIDSLPGRRLCILGLGVIGRYAARLGLAHGMHVVAVRRTASGERPQGRPFDGAQDRPFGPAPIGIDAVERIFTPDQLHDALDGADVVINLLPYSPATDQLIGAAEFERMAGGAYFLNAGRGRTVDTDALVAALASGKLGGAGLDVTDPEPLPPDHPLWTAPNVIITPHCAGNVHDYDARAREIFLANLRCYLAGSPLPDAVDKEAGY